MPTNGIPPSLEHLAHDIADLTPFHRNPRVGNARLIADSLEANGQYRAIVANRGTHTGRPNEVLAGNHTLAAAQLLGWDRIATTWVDVDDDHATRIVLADNRTADVATYDDGILADLLADLDGDLDGTGYTVDDVDLFSSAPDLDDLAAEFGEPADDDLWPVLTFKVPPNVRQDFYDLTDGCPDDSPSGRFVHLVGQMRAAA